jgi:hypothetical protein
MILLEAQLRLAAAVSPEAARLGTGSTGTGVSRLTGAPSRPERGVWQLLRTAPADGLAVQHG